ncbi:hypothetical protein HAX54_015885, partial [Datura stramonium]|nr:hypothetical protein [Datura stramonium]
VAVKLYNVVIIVLQYMTEGLVGNSRGNAWSTTVRQASDAMNNAAHEQFSDGPRVQSQFDEEQKLQNPIPIQAGTIKA